MERENEKVREYVKIWSETSYCEKSFQAMNICCPFNMLFLQELTIYIAKGFGRKH